MSSSPQVVAEERDCKGDDTTLRSIEKALIGQAVDESLGGSIRHPQGTDDLPQRCGLAAARDRLKQASLDWRRSGQSGVEEGPVEGSQQGRPRPVVLSLRQRR